MHCCSTLLPRSSRSFGRKRSQQEGSAYQNHQTRDHIPPASSTRNPSISLMNKIAMSAIRTRHIAKRPNLNSTLLVCNPTHKPGETPILVTFCLKSPRNEQQRCTMMPSRDRPVLSSLCQTMVIDWFGRRVVHELFVFRAQCFAIASLCLQ